MCLDKAGGDDGAHPWNCGLLLEGEAIASAAPKVIRRYNTSQIISGLLRIVLGAVAFWLAFIFFRFGAEKVVHHYPGISRFSPSQIAAACTALMGLGGLWQWRKGEGHTTFAESNFFTMQAVVNSASDTRLTLVGLAPAMAYMLSQIFLAGPLRVLRAFEHWKSRIPNSPVLENELIALHGQLRAKNKWLPVSEFVGREQHIVYLARLDLIDWSPRKGTLRAR